jgi:hypothetical protein
VPVQQLFVDAGPLGDPIDPGAGQAVFDELLDGRAQDALGGGRLGRRFADTSALRGKKKCLDG